MKRIPALLCIVLGGLLLMGADGCSSDPNVEGAKLDLRNKDYDRALQNLETALSNNPDNAEALELKGRVLTEKAFETEDPAEHAALIQEMVAAFDRAVEIDPLLLETVQRNKAIAYVREFERGIQAFNRGANDASEFEASALYFGTAAVIQPDSADAYTNQAYAFLNGGMETSAAEPFEMAIELGDTDVESFRFLSRIYLNNDRAAEAVTTLETAAELYPENIDVQAELLNAYQLAGQTDRALDTYARAVADSPDNKLFRYNYGSLLVSVERYDDAIEQLSAAVALDAEYANAQYNLGAAYINKAVAVNDQINTKDDELRENRSSLSSDEIATREAEIDALAEERRSLFAAAIAPLEAARTLVESEGEDATAICLALFQSYVQNNMLDQAEEVSECAGTNDS
ncbi:MAG: tetratricopeptide repeat protein [Rhodothermales bacterium]|nr:tetratricopeptide repeat protein [Rhodothermales bacterium]MBO6780889.1 tetratricopeptide repeat protein [Rhodothermales bacterium]